MIQSPKRSVECWKGDVSISCGNVSTNHPCCPHQLKRSKFKMPMQDVVRRSGTFQQAAVEPAGLNRQQHCNRQYSNRPYENSDVTAVYGTVYSCDATGCAETEISSKHKAYFAWRTEVGGRAVQQLDGETMVFDCPDPRTLSSQTTVVAISPLTRQNFLSQQGRHHATHLELRS